MCQKHLLSRSFELATRLVLAVAVIHADLGGTFELVPVEIRDEPFPRVAFARDQELLVVKLVVRSYSFGLLPKYRATISAGRPSATSLP